MSEGKRTGNKVLLYAQMSL